MSFLKLHYQKLSNRFNFFTEILVVLSSDTRSRKIENSHFIFVQLTTGYSGNLNKIEILHVIPISK